MSNPTDVSDKHKFFDPVRGEPPEDCDVLGWSCACDPDEGSYESSFAAPPQSGYDRNVSTRNAMLMGAGGSDGGYR